MSVSIKEVVEAYQAGLLSNDEARDATYSILEFEGLVVLRETPAPKIVEALAASAHSS